MRDAAAADADLRETLQALPQRLGAGPVEGALLFSCNGRGAHLFGTADHDPAARPVERWPRPGVAGCFAAGEIGPVGGRNFVHGFTASILAFGSTERMSPSGPVLAIDVGGTKLAAGLVDDDGAILRTARDPDRPGG